MRIRITKRVRELLAEQAKLFETFHEQTGVLADRGTPDAIARDTGANREYTRNQILGVAHQINEALKKSCQSKSKPLA